MNSSVARLIQRGVRPVITIRTRPVPVRCVMRDIMLLKEHILLAYPARTATRPNRGRNIATSAEIRLADTIKYGTARFLLVNIHVRPEKFGTAPSVIAKDRAIVRGAPNTGMIL